MSNPNMFNGDLAQTNLESAYQFSSFSPYIMNGGLDSRFSPICIFCSSNNTMNLAKDGSFKQCNSCKKQFKAQLSNNQVNQQLHYFPPYRAQH
jgi:hypothetical protein